jgi:hypothetical protein
MSSASALTPEIIQHATTFLTVWWTPTMILAYLIGLVLFGSGLVKLAKGEKLGAGITTVVIAAIMLGLPGFLNLMSGSFFAVAAPDGLHYVAPQGIKNAGLITLCIRGVQLMGLLALVRSLLFFKDYANEQQSQLLYQGCSFFFGSLACINIVQLLDYFGDWFGGDINFIVDMLI